MVPDGILWVLMAVYWGAAFVLQLYGLNSYVMVALFNRRRFARVLDERRLLDRFRREHGDDDLPIVTTQLPIFNERNVIERLLRAVCAFDYPVGKHEIQVLDDSTDDTVDLVRRLVGELRAAGHDVTHVRRGDRSGYKAGALEAGLTIARGELVAVFDADFVPPPDFLRRTVPFLVMDPDCGFVQTRWGHRNRGFSPLTRVQAIGIDGHFVIEQSARSWNRLFLNFNGTGGVWRRRAIADAGGWQADTLTEDLDLSYRTQLAGWKPRYLLDVVTPAELPTDINALKSQQHRWAKGSIQTARKLLPVVWRRPDLSPFMKVEATLHLTHYVVHPLMLIMTLLVLPLMIWTRLTFHTAWMAVPFAFMFVALFAPTTMYLLSQRASNHDWKRTLWLLPLLMSVGIGLAVNNSRAVLQAITGRPGEFVRTPKLGAAAEVHASGVGSRRAGSQRAGGGAKRATTPALEPGSLTRHYRLPGGRIFLVEIAVGLWALAAFIEYLMLRRLIASPLLLIHAVGFTYVGVSSLMHDLRARRRVG